MRSTIEVELAALDTTTVEAGWLRELLMDLPIVEKPLPTRLMNCDNQTVIVKVDSSNNNMTDEDVGLLREVDCDILAQGLKGLIEYSYHQGIPSFSEAHL
jgi:hypothetical protein